MNKGYSATNSKVVKSAKKRLSKFLSKLDSIPSEELQKAANIIYTKALAQVPYDTGKLSRSIRVTVSKSKSKYKQGINASASALAYRKPSKTSSKSTDQKPIKTYNYAGIQHDNPYYTHALGRKYHYLSDPFNQEVYNMERRIKRRFDRELKGK